MAYALRTLLRNPEIWLEYGISSLRPVHYTALAGTGSKISTTRINSPNNSRLIHTRLTPRNLGNFLHATSSIRSNTRIGVSSTNVRPRCQSVIGTYQLISLRCYSDSRPKSPPPNELADAWKTIGPHAPKILIALIVITGAIALPL